MNLARVFSWYIFEVVGATIPVPLAGYVLFNLNWISARRKSYQK